MKLTLAQNIRSFRKQRDMTQEKLAEVLGVTVGAVHKWEAGLSVPELDLIIRMADFFDVSVDVLLGYRMKDNRPDAIVERLEALCRTMDPAAVSEAEKALGRYPHSFRVVCMCAEVYLIIGSGVHDPVYLRRALELLEQAMVLLPQNDDPRISETTISGGMSFAYFSLGETEKAVEILKRNNTSGCFSDQIGIILAANMKRTEEAVPYLSEAMANGMISLMQAAFGYIFVYRARNDWDSALAVMTLCDALITGLKTDGPAGFLDKILAEERLLLAYVDMKAGMPEASEEALRQAAGFAARFDSTPEYSLRSMRFLEDKEHTGVFDALGATAAEGIAYLLGLLNDEDFTARWKEIADHE